MTEEELDKKLNWIEEHTSDCTMFFYRIDDHYVQDDAEVLKKIREHLKKWMNHPNGIYATGDHLAVIAKQCMKDCNKVQEHICNPTA